MFCTAGISRGLQGKLTKLDHALHCNYWSLKDILIGFHLCPADHFGTLLLTHSFIIITYSKSIQIKIKNLGIQTQSIMTNWKDRMAQNSTYDDREDMVLANMDPGFAIKQITPEVISSQPADETTETGPPKVNLPFLACTLPLSSPGEKPEQAAPLSGSPTKNRDSTLPLASSNNSMNGQDTQKLQKVNKQRQR